MSKTTKGRGGVDKLDDLMMAYADLNTTSRNKGFKGPPVKDIKRETKSVSYQSSNKARNWKTLDQSLESAFSRADHTPIAPLPTMNPVGDIASFFQINSGPSQAVNPAPAPTNTLDDEWGDFQAFPQPQGVSVKSSQPTNFSTNLNQPSSFAFPSQPSTLTSVPSQPGGFPTSLSQPSNVTSTPSQPTNFQYPAPSLQGSQSFDLSTSSTFTQSSQQPLSLPPLSVSNTTTSSLQPSSLGLEVNQMNQGFPQTKSINNLSQDLSTLAVTPLTDDVFSFPKSSTNGQKPAENTIFNNDKGSHQTVGCRLASFQEESPVHRFKPAQKAPSLEDFGDFADFQSAPGQSVNPPTTQSVPEPSMPTPVLPSLQSTPGLSNPPFPEPSAGNLKTPSIIEPAVAPVQDKYSALRDLFSTSSGVHDTSSDNLILDNSGSKSNFVKSPGSPGLSFPKAESHLKPAVPGNVHNTSSEQLLSSPFNLSSENPVSLESSRAPHEVEDFWSLPGGPAPLPAAEPNPWNSAPVKSEDDFGDFGDFVEPFPQQVNTAIRAPVEEGEVDEWCLPSSADDRQESPQRVLKASRTKAYGGLFPEQQSNSSNLPFFSSSPPVCSTPPPLDTSPPVDGLEFALPSEQLQLSDQELFGTGQEKPKPGYNAPSSLHDVIHQQSIKVKKVEKKTNNVIDALSLGSSALVESKSTLHSDPGLPGEDGANQDVIVSSGYQQSTHPESREKSPDSPFTSLKNPDSPTSSLHLPGKIPDSPASLRLPSRSPESVSIASLELDTEMRQESVAEDSVSKLERSRLTDSWTAALTQLHVFIDAAAQTYRIEEEEIKFEVLASEQGNIYLKNIREMYLVFSRIERSVQSLSLADVELKDLIWRVNKSWKTLKTNTNNSETLTRADQRANYDDNCSAQHCCGICLISVDRFTTDVIEDSRHLGDFNTGVLAYNGTEYHAACANFWINCVDSNIPNFNSQRNFV